MGLIFEWDEQKAKSNLKKQGITFEEASTVFGDSLSLTVPDPMHSVGEERLITVGQSCKGRLVVVAHSEKGDNVRIISARKATRKERKGYEKG